MRILFTSALLTSAVFTLGANAQQPTHSKPGSDSGSKVQPITSVSLSPDGKLLATANRSEVGQLWDTATGKLIRQVPAYNTSASGGYGVQYMMDSAVFSGDGKLLVTCHQGGYIEFWDTTTWKSVRGLAPEGNNEDWRWGKGYGSGYYEKNKSSPAWSVATSNDGKWLVTGGNSEARLWDVTLGKNIFTVNVPEIQFVALSGDGNTLAAACQAWDLRKIKEFYQVGIAHGLWNDSWALTMRKTRWPFGHCQPLLQDKDQPLALSSDGKLLVQPNFSFTVGPGEFRLRTYLSSRDPVTAKSIRNFDWPVYDAPPIKCLALTNDNKWLIGGGGKTPRLWNVSSGKAVRVFQGHTDQVLSLSISGDSKLLATGSSDGTARLWDIATGKEIRVFQK